MIYTSAFNTISKGVIQITLTLMLVLFAWVSYHQLMSTMSMDSMADHKASPLSCLTLCIIAAEVDTSVLTQSLYFTFADSTVAFFTLLALSALTYLAVYYLRHNLATLDVHLQRSKQYYYLQRWKCKLFSLWSRLYQHGVIAPQIYS